MVNTFSNGLWRVSAYSAAGGEGGTAINPWNGHLSRYLASSLERRLIDTHPCAVSNAGPKIYGLTYVLPFSFPSFPPPFLLQPA